MNDTQVVYVSKYPIKMGPGDTRLPGSLVPEFENWSYSVQKAYLDRGHIEKMSKSSWVDMVTKVDFTTNPVIVTTKIVKPSTVKPKTNKTPPSNETKVETHDVVL